MLEASEMYQTFLMFMLLSVSYREAVAEGDCMDKVSTVLQCLQAVQGELKAEINSLKEKVSHLEKENQEKDVLIRRILEDGSEIRKQLEELKDEQVIVEIESEVLDNQESDTKEEVSELSGEQKTFYSAKLNNASQAPSQSTSVDKRILLHGGAPAEYPRVAFSSYLSHSLLNLGPEQAIVYDKVILNEGLAYNNATGTFTVPVSGLYLFSWSSVASQAPGSDAYDVWISIMVNTDRLTTAVGDSRGEWEDNQGSNTIILHVNKGDVVFTEHYGGTTLFADSRHRVTTFSGVLLYAD